MYSVPEAQFGQPLWCKCGQSIAVAAPPPAVGPGPPTGEAMHWTRKFAIGLRVVRLIGVLAVVIWLAISQFTAHVRPRSPAPPPPPAVAPLSPDEPPPMPQMPWPSGQTPGAPPAVQPPTSAAPQNPPQPGALMGEPLLKDSAQAKVTTVTRADADSVTVEFTWPREPTEADKDRCFAVVSVGDPQLEMAAMALQGMAGPSFVRQGPRPAQLRTGLGVQAASNADWVVQSQAEASRTRTCRLTVSLANPAGVPALPSGPGQSADVWAQLFDFGTMPPTALSKPQKGK
jgi:hypothetical protein